MHRGEKPRDTETGQPCPYRLVADAEIPRCDHGVGAADQVIHRQHTDPAVAHGNAAVGGVVAVVAHHEQPSRRHRHFRRVVEPPIVTQLENLVTDAIRQSLDVAIRRLHAAPVVFCLANPVGLQLGGMIVDEELAMPDLDTIAGKADNSLDPGLRPVTRPAEYNDIAALWRFAEYAASLGKVNLDRQRSGAVTV